MEFVAKVNVWEVEGLPETHSVYVEDLDYLEGKQFRWSVTVNDTSVYGKGLSRGEAEAKATYWYKILRDDVT